MKKLFTSFLVLICFQVLPQPFDTNTGNKVYLNGTDGSTLSLQCSNGKLKLDYKYLTYDVDFFVIERYDGPATSENPYALLYGAMSLPQQKALEQLTLAKTGIIVTRYPKGTQKIFFREVKENIPGEYIPVGQEFFPIENELTVLIKDLRNSCNDPSALL